MGLGRGNRGRGGMWPAHVVCALRESCGTLVSVCLSVILRQHLPPVGLLVLESGTLFVYNIYIYIIYINIYICGFVLHAQLLKLCSDVSVLVYCLGPAAAAAGRF